MSLCTTRVADLCLRLFYCIDIIVRGGFTYIMRLSGENGAYVESTVSPGGRVVNERVFSRISR